MLAARIWFGHPRLRGGSVDDWEDVDDRDEPSHGSQGCIQVSGHNRLLSRTVVDQRPAMMVSISSC
jgi:hypothetical protein